jgi:hypothetical protein
LGVLIREKVSAKGMPLSQRKTFVFCLLSAKRIAFLGLNFLIYRRFLALFQRIQKLNITKEGE